MCAGMRRALDIPFLAHNHNKVIDYCFIKLVGAPAPAERLAAARGMLQLCQHEQLRLAIDERRMVEGLHQIIKRTLVPDVLGLSLRVFLAAVRLGRRTCCRTLTMAGETCLHDDVPQCRGLVVPCALRITSFRSYARPRRHKRAKLSTRL